MDQNHQSADRTNTLGRGGNVEENSRILDKMLRYYEGYFDLEKPFAVGHTVYNAYGYFQMTNTKYVLTREAQLWRTCLFEHLFFKLVDAFTDEKMDEYQQGICDELEPEFVRKGGKYPPPDHMSTCLTHVFICSQAVTKNVARRIRGYKFRRYYRFALRGYCEGRLLVIDLEKRTIYGNSSAKKIMKNYRRLFQQEGIK